MPDTNSERTILHAPSDPVDASATPTLLQNATGTARTFSGSMESDVPGYEILGELGRGGMGVVFEARQIALNRSVALKMVLGGDRPDPKELVRFLAEAESAAAVKHANVVQVYEYGEAAGRPFLALELCPNGSLAKRLATARPNVATAVDLVRQIAFGVHAAHNEGIVHRDLKPGNVLFDAEGRPKVTDFGLAKRGLGSDLTKSNAVMGTPAYMAPEQAKGDSKFVGPTADVWALGVILYECLTGRTPFRADDAWAILHNVLTADPLPLRKLVPSLPPDLEQVCLKCLRKEPHERYASAKLFADDLTNYLEGRAVTARPIGAVPRAVRWCKRNPAIAAGLAGVMVLTIGLIAALAFGYQQAVAQADTERGRAEAESQLRQKEAEAKAEAEKAKAEADRLREDAEAAKADAIIEAERANQVSEFLTQTFRSTDPLDIFGENLAPPSWEKQRNRTAVDLLRDASLRFQTLFRDQPRARAKLLASLGSSYLNLGLFREAEPLLQEALQLRRASLPADHPDIAQSEYDLGRYHLDSGNFEPAVAKFRTAAAIQARAKLPASVVTTTRTFEAWALAMLGSPEAEPLVRELLAFRDATDGPTHKNTLNVLMGWIGYLIDNGRNAEAIAVMPRLLAAIAAQPDGQIQKIAQTTIDFQAAIGFRSQANVATFFLNQAEKSFRKSLAGGELCLPADHIYLSVIRFELALTLLEIGKSAEADELFVRVLGDVRKTCGLAHPKAMLLIHSYAERLAALKRLPDARALYDEAVAASRERFGPANHWLALLLARRVEFEVKFGDVARAIVDTKAIGNLVDSGSVSPTPHALRDLVEAGRAYRFNGSSSGRIAGADLLASTRRLLPRRSESPTAMELLLIRDEGDMRYLAGQYAQGAKLLEGAVALDTQHPTILSAMNRNWLYFYIGRVETARGRFPEAEAAYRKANDVAEKLGKNRPDRRDDTLALAGALVDLGRYAEAVPLLEAPRKSPARDTDVADTAKNLAIAHILIAKVASGDLAAADDFVKTRLAGDLDTLILVARLAGLIAKPTAWDAAKVLDRLTAALRTNPKHRAGPRAVPLLQVRAGLPLEASLNMVALGGPKVPYDYAVLGLADLDRGKPASARRHLAEAERLLQIDHARQPDAFPYINVDWFDRLEVTLLVDELRVRFGASSP